jgi:hypothetical protein
MALTAFQRDVCRLLAGNRLRSGESYVAGGAALNELLRAPRLSRDLDLFQDTEAALAASWSADRSSLEGQGYRLSVVRERPTFVEAEVRRGDESVVIQWAHDSAYRFFPLVQHAELGLALHPFDLATSKVLALVGRVEPRDFVDTLTCEREVQPLGYLAWAACGKDPGFSPAAILELAARSARYSEAELRGLDFEGAAPDAGSLARLWRDVLDRARETVAALPADEAGRAVLTADGAPFRGEPAALRAALRADDLRYHEGSIRGAFPRIVR